MIYFHTVNADCYPLTGICLYIYVAANFNHHNTILQPQKYHGILKFFHKAIEHCIRAILIDGRSCMGRQRNTFHIRNSITTEFHKIGCICWQIGHPNSVKTAKHGFYLYKSIINASILSSSVILLNLFFEIATPVCATYRNDN